MDPEILNSEAYQRFVPQLQNIDTSRNVSNPFNKPVCKRILERSERSYFFSCFASLCLYLSVIRKTKKL